MPKSRKQPPETGNSLALPDKGRLMGFDFGTVRVGIAICDESQSIASPLETYTRRTETADARYFQNLVSETTVVGLVVGLPLHMSGDESQKSTEARSFGNWLNSITGLPVDWIDERYSTAYAKEILAAGKLTAKQKKARLDKVAAQAILATYLESSSFNRQNRSIED